MSQTNQLTPTTSVSAAPMSAPSFNYQTRTHRESRSNLNGIHSGLTYAPVFTRSGIEDGGR